MRKKYEPAFYRKVILHLPGKRRRVAWETPPITFDELSAEDYLDTSDLETYFDCSVRTIYRWNNEFGLIPSIKLATRLFWKTHGPALEKATPPQAGAAF